MIEFDDMITHTFINKKLQQIETVLFTWGRKLNIWLVFVMQTYFSAKKNKIRLSSEHYSILIILNKQEL